MRNSKMNKIHNTGLLLIMVSFMTMAGSVGSRFSYQGELLSNDAPANGIYDLKMELWSTLTGGTTVAASITLEDVEVINGLFNIELDFGDAVYNGEDNYLKIQVRDGDSTGSFTSLSPRQRINATPYAVQAEFVENGASQWLDETGGIRYIDGSVSVGSITPGNYKLVVRAANGENPFYTSIDGVGQVFAVRSNSGVNIGSADMPPANGIYVNGIAKQKLESHGFVKAGTFIQCGGAGASGGSSRYFNNVNSSDFSTTGFSTGSCKITIPFDISNLFFTASVAPSGGLAAGSQNVSCAFSNTGTNELFCNINQSQGSAQNGELQLMFY